MAILILLPVIVAVEETDLVEINRSFAWYGDEVGINFSHSLSTFVYSSAAWPLGKHVYDCDAFFLYYEDDLEFTLAALMGILDTSNIDIYVVLDPDPPAPETTFLDLYYDMDLRIDMIDDIDVKIADLTELGVFGFVMGDEWPRGLNSEEITVELLSRYNQTYHADEGSWMRPNPGAGERISMVEWFYNRSIDAWNMIAREVRNRHPEVRLGTNIDLSWQGDPSHSNLAHWKLEGWWNQVELEPYDFVVTHYFTHVDWENESPTPHEFDSGSLQTMGESLEGLQRHLNGTQGTEVFLLLGAHCVYPRAKTPMQMILEWNLAMKFNDFLSGVGWFIFDLWISNDGKSIESFSIADTIIQSPMKMERLSTLKVLLDNPLRHPDIPRETSNVDVVWLRTLGSSGNGIESCSTISDDEGSYLIAGTLTTSSGSSHAYLVKLDRNGSQVWDRTYKGRGTDKTGAAARCWNDGFVLAGTYGNGGIFVLRTDPSGNLSWEARYDIDGIKDVACIIQDNTGDFIVSGTVMGESGDNALMMKILSSGDPGWHEIYNSGLDDSVHWTFDGNGSYYIIGDAWRSGGSKDMLVIRVDAEGQFIWRRTFGGAGMDSATYGLMDEENTVVVAGRSATRGHDGPYLMGIDADGNTIFDRTYQWDGGTILDMSTSPNGGFCAIGRGGSLLKLDDNWNRVWDTGWEPVGPRASMSSNGDGYYLIAGSISGKTHAVRVHEPVVEIPAILLPAFFLSLLLLSSVQQFSVY